MTGQGERLLSVGGCDTLIGIGALSRIRIELDKSPIKSGGKLGVQNRIGHFRITFSLFLKASLGAHPFI